jgi:predicted nucleic acid-binding protein
VTVATIIDAGPLVAFFSKRDLHHDWAVAQFARLMRPLLTCEPVLTEACYLLESGGIDPTHVLQAVSKGGLKVDFSLTSEIGRVSHLMMQYRDAGISLADACLVRMSEMKPQSQVMTIDRDFLVYRRDGRRTIPLVAPFDH